MDEPPLRAVVPELAAQAMHCHAHDLTRGRVVVPGDTLRYGGRRHDRVLVSHQVIQKPELVAGEPQGLALDLDRSLRGVEPERPDLQDGRGLYEVTIELGATVVSPDAGNELAMPKRLDHVVVGAYLESTDLVVLAVPTREHDDGHRLAPTAQLRYELEPVPGLQIEVDDGHRRGFPVEKLERTYRFRGGERREPCLFDEKGKKLDKVPVVVDDEDPRPRVPPVIHFSHPAYGRAYKPGRLPAYALSAQ